MGKNSSLTWTGTAWYVAAIVGGLGLGAGIKSLVDTLNAVPIPSDFSFNGPEDFGVPSSSVRSLGSHEYYDSVQKTWVHETQIVEYTIDESMKMDQLKAQIQILETDLRNASTVDEQARIINDIKEKRAEIVTILNNAFERQHPTKAFPIPPPMGAR